MKPTPKVNTKSGFMESIKSEVDNDDSKPGYTFTMKHPQSDIIDNNNPNNYIHEIDKNIFNFFSENVSSQKKI